MLVWRLSDLVKCTVQKKKKKKKVTKQLSFKSVIIMSLIIATKVFMKKTIKLPVNELPTLCALTHSSRTFSSSDTRLKKYASKAGNLIMWKHSERDNTTPSLGDISGTKSPQHSRLTALNGIFLTRDHSTHEIEEVVLPFLNKGLCLYQLISVTSCGNCRLRQGFCSKLASITA